MSTFVEWLGGRGYRRPTIEEYGRLARRAQEAGDLLAPLRRAKSKPGWAAARSMAVAWAQYRGMDVDAVRAACDRVLRPRTRAQETLPARLADWRRIVGAVERLGEPGRSILLLVTTSGLRMGDLFRLSPEQARAGSIGAAVALERKRGVVRDWAPAPDLWVPLGRLAGIRGWKTLQELLGTDYRAAASRLRELLHQVAETAGVEYVRPHRFRHTVATALLTAGVELPAIQAVLAHGSWKETMRYLHVDAETQRAAAAKVGDVLRRSS